MQVAFGLALSADIVLAAYIYQLVPPRNFVAVTAVASAASLLGLVLGAESSEILLALGVSLTSLFYISLATVSSSAVLTLWLPASSASVARLQSSVRPSSQAQRELMALCNVCVRKKRNLCCPLSLIPSLSANHSRLVGTRALYQAGGLHTR